MRLTVSKHKALAVALLCALIIGLLNPSSATAGRASSRPGTLSAGMTATTASVLRAHEGHEFQGQPLDTQAQIEKYQEEALQALRSSEGHLFQGNLAEMKTTTPVIITEEQAKEMEEFNKFLQEEGMKFARDLAVETVVYATVLEIEAIGYTVVAGILGTAAFVIGIAVAIFFSDPMVEAPEASIPK